VDFPEWTKDFNYLTSKYTILYFVFQLEKSALMDRGSEYRGLILKVN
jgi:hypothetical protein